MGSTIWNAIVNIVLLCRFQFMVKSSIISVHVWLNQNVGNAHNCDAEARSAYVPCLRYATFDFICFE